MAAGNYLVTGGAGFVGSHLVALLTGLGHQVTVVDTLQTGHRAAVPSTARLVIHDIGDGPAMEALLAESRFDGVFHFAALSLVGESMRDPLRYLVANAADGMRLIQLCARHGVTRFVLSSTAAVFGEPKAVPIPESAHMEPTSPYGEAKLMLERALHWAGQAHGLRSAVLRYFNAAGSDPAGRLGEHHVPETHLIPLAIDAALGRREKLTVFGTDYDTPDGTCIRDYVHVSDLADAHVLAMERLDHGSITCNLGSGTGYSVREVLDSVGRILERPVPAVFGERRPGDPARLIASSDRARRELGWEPKHTRLDDIVRTAASWRIVHPRGYG